MQQTYQRLIVVGGDQYLNFFFVPGSMNSLRSFLEKGYTVKFIKDNGREASILFEKVY